MRANGKLPSIVVVKSTENGIAVNNKMWATYGIQKYKTNLSSAAEFTISDLYVG